MTTIDKIVFSQNAPAKNTLWARPSEKGTELLIFNKGKWGIVGADDFQRFHYEVYPSLEDITEPKPNALYLIGPKGEGEDKYDEYVYTEEGFTKIGDTSIDMSDVIKYNKYSDSSYTLKAEGTEIKKLRMTDDSTMILGNNNSIGFGASGTINMQSGNISGVKDIQMTYGKIDNLWDIYGGYNDTHIYMTGNNNINVDGATIDNVGTISGSSGGMSITASGTGVTINGVSMMSSGPNISGVNKLTFHTGGSIDNVGNITMYNGTLTGVRSIKVVRSIDFEDGATLTTGNGAVATGTGAVWANNFGVSGDLLFSEGSSVRRKFLSGTLPMVTIERTIQPGRFIYTDTISLGMYKALSVIDSYQESTPLQPDATPLVKVSGILRVSGTIQPGDYYNKISGGWNGIDINTSGGATNPRVAINGVEINKSGSISEVATLSFKSGGTLAPSINGVQEIFGKNNVHISMSGSTTGDGIDFGNAPLKRVNGIQLTGTSGYIDMDGGKIYNASGVTLTSGGTLTFGDGTTMNTATSINLDDADNVIGGKELKLYYPDSSGVVRSASPLYYYSSSQKFNLNVGEVRADNFYGYFSGTLSGSVTDASSIIMLNGLITGVKGIHMATGGYINMKSGTLYMMDGCNISGYNNTHIAGMVYESGNTFTTGFIDELKAALGIS